VNYLRVSLPASAILVEKYPLTIFCFTTLTIYLPILFHNYNRLNEDGNVSDCIQ